MTYWIVIAMIFVAILAVALVAATAPDTNDNEVADDPSREQGSPADDYS